MTGGKPPRHLFRCEPSSALMESAVIGCLLLLFVLHLCWSVQGERVGPVFLAGRNPRRLTIFYHTKVCRPHLSHSMTAVTKQIADRSRNAAFARQACDASDEDDPFKTMFGRSSTIGLYESFL